MGHRSRCKPRARWSVIGQRLIMVVIAALTLAQNVVVRSQEPSPPRGLESLTHRVESVLTTAGFEHGHWGILVVDRKTRETIYERNADLLFAPASVAKLFSTAAALVELGPNFRFQTPLLRRGDVDANGILHGDLILLAQGDLAMGGRTGPEGKLVFHDDDHTYAEGNFRSQTVPTDPLAGLDHIAREVQAAGIREVTGLVIIDDRLFAEAEATGSGPKRVSPIVINDNVIDILARPADKVGEPAIVAFQPATQFMTMDAQVMTVDAGKLPSLDVLPAGSRGFAVRGRLPVGSTRVVKIREVEEPASFARALLIEALRRHGVRVLASPLDDNDTGSLAPRTQVAKLSKVAEYTSPPFSEYIRIILKVSHNLHASTLPLLLAARHGERTLAQGLKRQGEILRNLGVDPKTVCFGSGAGGARADLASPRATVNLLRAIALRPEFAVFDAALPILGRDGTLAKAVAEDSPARAHAHAKTGTYFVANELDGTTVLTSKALAGYLETASGRSLIFAVFVNNVPLDAPKPGRSVSEATAAAGRLLGKLCEVFYADTRESSITSTPHSPAPCADGDSPRPIDVKVESPIH